MTPERRPLRWLHLLGSGRPRPEESAELEIEHHIAELTDRMVGEGLDPEEARREAERHFGDRARHAAEMRRLEEAGLRRDALGAAFEVGRQSIVSVVRTAHREPGFTAAVVLTLGLGIGANATMYGIIDRLLLSPPEHIVGAEDVRRLYSSRANARTGEVVRGDFSYPDFAALRAHGGMEVAAYQDDYEHTIGSGPSAFRVRTHLVTAELFPLLGVEPRLGRFFTSEDAAIGAPLSAVLSEELWRSAYGADPDVLSRTIEIDGHVVPVIGVAPGGFTGVGLSPVDIWLPLEPWSSLDPGTMRGSTSSCMENWDCRWMAAVARLGEGASEESASVEATRLHRNAREAIGAPAPTQTPTVLFGPLIAARGQNPSSDTRVAVWLGGMSMIVVLVACANVANLLLARASRRRRDLAVRRALGVGRARIMTQSVLDTLVLALVGGVLAVALTRWGGTLIRSTLLPEVAFADPVNARVLVYTASITLLVGLITSFAPAFLATRFDVSDELTRASGSFTGMRSSLRSTLTVVQASLCAVLLVGAGLFVRSLVVLRSTDLGLDADRLIVVDLELTTADPEPELVASVYQDAMRALAALPEIESVAATSSPFGVVMTMRGVRTPGTDSLPGLAVMVPVGPGYFETTGIEIVDGRGIDERDVAGADPIVVVNETMASTVWPGEPALGQCLLVDGSRETCVTVVGVAEPAALASYRNPEMEMMAYYLSMEQLPEISPRTPPGVTPLGIYVRPRDGARNAEGSIARTLRTISPLVRWARVMPIDDTLWRQARSWTLGATMFTIFGLLALVVASVGLYSVLAFDVAQRTREIGIRSALGARKAHLLHSVITRGATMGAIGVALGLAAAYFAAPRIQDLLFETSPRDPSVFTTVAVVLLAVSVAASWVPALRATRVDPVTALKAE